MKKTVCSDLNTKKVIRKTVSPILNIALPLFISKLAGLALKSQPVKSKCLHIEFRYLYEMYNNFEYKELFHLKFLRGNIKKWEIYQENTKGEVFLHTL